MTLTRLRGHGVVGDHVDTVGVDGVVERMMPHHFLVRIERPVSGLLSCFWYGTDASAVVYLSAYLYGPEGAAAAEPLRPQWHRCWTGLLATRPSCPHHERVSNRHSTAIV